ncbi:hypothetical protein FRC16_011020 [Serendipita sp. 398]|nr:hypothetical protein FRC16_011020 [Serendipita sp. 398]
MLPLFTSPSVSHTSLSSSKGLLFDEFSVSGELAGGVTTKFEILNGISSSCVDDTKRGQKDVVEQFDNALTISRPAAAPSISYSSSITRIDPYFRLLEENPSREPGRTNGSVNSCDGSCSVVIMICSNPASTRRLGFVWGHGNSVFAW